MSNLIEIAENIINTGPTPSLLEALTQSLDISSITDISHVWLQTLADDSQIGSYIKDELCKEIRKRVLKSNFLLKVSYNPTEDSYTCHVRATTAETLEFFIDNPVAYLSKEDLSNEDLAKMYNILEEDCEAYITRKEGSYDITLEKLESDSDSLILNSNKWNLIIPIQKIYDPSIRELIDMMGSLCQKL